MVGLMIEPFPLPTHPGKPIHWQQLPGGASAKTIAHAVMIHDGPVVVITPDAYSATQCRHACDAFLKEKDGKLPNLTLPDWEILPYDHFSPHQDIISERLKTLSQLSSLDKGLIVVPIATALQRLAPRSHVSQCFSLRVGDSLSLDGFRQQCVRAGYYAVSQVMSHGEFAVRGELIDLYPMGANLPIRIDLLHEEIESLRVFDPDDQRTVNKIDSIKLLPAYEFPMTETGITRFREQWRQTFTGDPMQSPIYQNISEGRTIGGIEYYLPLFFEATETLFDYLADSTCFILMDAVKEQIESFTAEVNERFEQRRGDITRPLLSPEQLFCSADQFYSQLKTHRQVRIHAGQSTQKPSVDFECKALPTISVNPHAMENRFSQLKQFLSETDLPCLLCAESPGRVELIHQMLNKEGLNATLSESIHAFHQSKPRLAITQARLHRGYIDPRLGVSLVAENDLFGEPVYQTRKSKSTLDPENVFKSLAELNIGSAVVHRDHGVGRYTGLKTLSVNETSQEFLIIEYADNDKLYVPIASLDCISRYSGVDLEHAPIHRLGGPEWEKLKKKASKRAHDVAAELLQLYALRATRKGFVFNVDQTQLATFSNEFPFEETPDQTTSIQNIIDDMQKPMPMDRLVCGDVGFGKTEVAMRAAFVAAMNGKQVAMLVPTTLLATQHYQTFTDRFTHWPVNIAVLSRLSTAKEQKNTREQIQAGNVDIVIGTHKILQSDIQFKALQLVIIDEEHRFGVRQKEYLKSLRAEVDILSMTATPIPRTLNMAMAGIRDLSIISTPPAKRLAIRTFVHEYDKQMIKEAIQREMMRGGQVFYLHNNVQTIQATVERLQEMIPEAKIAFAHGQMRERELERVMTAFYHHQYNILVCTTIIESGIDIPTANTMIIDRADRFGLAQLHQLRGRVGRSHHQAYAYLITPPTKAMTRDAQKRLEAIAQLDDLSVGFSIATLDSEIRGAGDFLGDEQSGHIEEIGFSLYQELLDRSIKALKEGKLPEQMTPSKQTELHFPATTLIPNDFIPDVHTRLVLYKRLADIKNKENLADFRAEMIDRFGHLPQAMDDLITLTNLKIQCQPLGIKKVDIGHQYGRIEFTNDTKIDPNTIIKLVQTRPKEFQLAGQNSLKFTLQSKEKTNHFKQLASVLANLDCST